MLFMTSPLNRGALGMDALQSITCLGGIANLITGTFTFWITTLVITVGLVGTPAQPNKKGKTNNTQIHLKNVFTGCPPETLLPYEDCSTTG